MLVRVALRLADGTWMKIGFKAPSSGNKPNLMVDGSRR
jgi:hypothetical protein